MRLIKFFFITFGVVSLLFIGYSFYKLHYDPDISCVSSIKATYHSPDNKKVITFYEQICNENSVITIVAFRVSSSVSEQIIFEGASVSPLEFNINWPDENTIKISLINKPELIDFWKTDAPINIEWEL